MTTWCSFHTLSISITKFQPNAYNDCYDLQQEVLSFKEILTAYVKGKMTLFLGHNEKSLV